MEDSENAAEPWVVYHNPDDVWWKPNRCGYTRELLGAGLYTESEARRCARMRSRLPNGTYEDEAMPLSVAWARAVKTLDGTVASLVRLGR